MRTVPRLLVLVLACSARPAAAAEPEAPPRGWHVVYESGLGTVEDHAAAAALALGAGETAHPALRERGWSARWSGVVRVPRDANYRFGVEVDGGDADLQVADGAGTELGVARASGRDTGMTAWIRLAAGDVLVRVRYTRAARGDGRLRTLWEEAPSADGGFRLEPIPSSAVAVPDARAAAVAAALTARRGRVLLERKGCTRCHAPDARAGLAVGSRPAPRLDGLGVRTGAVWLMRWLAAPQALRPGTDMPDVLAGASAAEREELVHFLLSGPEAAAAPPPAGDVAAGRRLFHVIGCVACHGPLASPATVFDDPLLPTAVTDAPPVPFGDLAGKWRTHALAGFLADPLATRPDGSMPSFLLAADEAADLAAFLTAALGAATDGFVPDTARAAAGASAFVRRGCAACHERSGVPPAPPPGPALHALDASRGCLDPADRTTPRYDLAEDERASLAAGLRAARAASGIAAPVDAALRGVERLRCDACHPLDGRGGVRAAVTSYFTTLDDRVDLGDEGRLPPDLSGAGFKLTTRWFGRVLADGARARRYMAARMPQFGAAHVAELPAAFAARAGGFPGHDLTPPPATDAHVLAGRGLVGRDGMSCITCHVHGDHAPAGSPGPDMTEFAERLRYEWWRAYIQAPSRYKPGTRMPAFATGRRSTVSNVLDGDIYPQADAMWAYFQLGEFMPVPAGLEAARGLAIEVSDRPVVLRTFLEHAGARGIAVGFPVGIHFAFDAARCRLVEAWKGAFLDASAAWAGRGGQVAEGRGPGLWTAPQGPPLRFGERPASWPADAAVRFRGYRLDAAGAPTFLYEIDGVPVAETPSARVVPADRLAREFRVEAPVDTVWLNAGGGAVAATAPGAAVTRHVQGDGTTWFEIRPRSDAGPLRVTLEVTP